MPGFFSISNKCYVCQHGFYFLNNKPHSTNSGGEVNLASYYTIILLGHTIDFRTEKYLFFEPRIFSHTN